MSPATPPVPPGPRLPATVQTALLLRDPVGFMRRCRQRHGAVFTARFVGMPPLAYVAEPELARQVFATDRDIGDAGTVRRDFLSPLVGQSSLLCLAGDEWLRHRKLLAPPFHGDVVESYREQIAAIAAREIETWPVGQEFRLRDRTQLITLEVILRVVFGIREPARLDSLRTLLPALIDLGGSFVWLLPPRQRERLERSRLLARVPGNPLARFEALRDEVDAILFDEIARRRRDPIEDGTDVLSLLLQARDEDRAGMTDQELRDELLTMLFAGHETTATALAWAFERLLRTPAALERLEAEVASANGHGPGEYVAAVARETLRARPVVMDAPRLLTGEIELGGHRVPAGWWIAPAIPLVHETSDTYPDADEFRPERFIGDDAPRDGWVPFGGGRRRCIGSRLALLEMEVIVAEIVSRVQLHAPDPAPEPARVAHVTLVPANGTRVQVVRRRDARPAPAQTASDRARAMASAPASPTSSSGRMVPETERSMAG